MPHKEEISKEFAKITKHYKEDTLDISAELIFRDEKNIAPKIRISID